MIDLESLIQGGISVLNINVILNLILGMFLGIIAGAIPGFSATMAVGILVPLTYIMSPLIGISFLAAIYAGAIYGGSIPAVLMNAPGTPSSIVTCLDGYPLTKKGKSSLGLGISLGSSILGGLISYLLLLFVMYPLAVFALSFGPTEMFMLAVFGLSIIASVSGKDFSKGFLLGLFGLLLGTVGVGPTGSLRGTYHYSLLYDGFPVVSILIGMFAFSELFYMVERQFIIEEKKDGGGNLKELFKGIIMPFLQPLNLLRSSLIGAFVGAIPAAGGSIATFIAYNEAKRASRNSTEFGKGSTEGLVASESSNNACAGGALITMFALGVPGTSTTAVMLGALMLHGLRPGPGLFIEQMPMVYGIIISLFIALIFMLFFGILASFYISKIIEIPINVLVPIIAIFCIMGSFAPRCYVFDSFIMCIFGILAYFLRKADYPVMALILGVILGPIAETQLVRFFMRFGNDWSQFFTRPISLFMIILTVISVTYSYIKDRS